MPQKHFEQEEDEDQEEELNEEEIVQVILELGNDILKNLGVEDRIDDVGVFFSDAFYIQFFEAAFPEFDFNHIKEATNEDEMARNIQDLIDLLGQQILKYDLSHIRGEEIVNGNPEHCINLLQLVQEISVMLQNKVQDSQQDEEDDGGHHAFMDQNKQLEEEEQEEEEDDEAQIIHERQKRQQQESSNKKNPDKSQASVKQPQSSVQKRGRSNSDDRGAKPAFQMDEFDDSNDFNMQMDQDDDEEEEFEKFQMQQQMQQQMKQLEQASNQKQQQKQIYQDDDEDEMEGEEGYNNEIDENDIEMYEKFLANNQPEQHLAMMGHSAPGGPQIHMDEEEEIDDNEEFDSADLENIDYNQLDPQILEIAEQMGVHPKEVLKQFLQLQSQGEDGMDEEEGMDDEEEEEQRLLEEERLRKEKELFKQQMGLKQPQKEPTPQKKPELQQQRQQVQQLVQGSSAKQQQKYEEDEDDEESYYSEGEINTRIKLLSKKSYSAPYIIINDCFDEPLFDDDESLILQKACSTTMLQNLEMQAQQMAELEGMEGEDMDEQTAMLLQQHQQQMIKQQQIQQQQQKQQQQQQQQQQPQKQAQKNQSKITEVSKSKESSSQQANKVNMINQQKFMVHDDDDEEEEDGVDIDMSQKLQELHQRNESNQNQEHGDGEEEEDDDMLIDLDQLDDEQRQLLLEFLHSEYQKNPDQFPYPKELIEEYMVKYQQKQSQEPGDIESVRDIKSEEMIVEDAGHSGQHIQGGEQQVEDEGEGEEEEDDLTPEQQMQLQQLLQQQQMQQQMQNDYGDEVAHDQMQQQLQQQYYQQQQQQQVQQRPMSGKSQKPKRSKSAGKKKKLAAQQQQNQMYQQQQQPLQIPEEQLAELAQILQEQNIDIENVDPNLLQQMLIAQAQQQQLINQERQSRPVTSKKRKSSAPKKKSTTKMTQINPYMAQSNRMKVLLPSTPGSNHFKSFNTQRSNQVYSKKKPKKKSPKRVKKTAQTLEPSNAMPLNVQGGDVQQIPQDGPHEEAIQALQAMNAQIIPNISEEFLNQLSEEQLEQLLQHQQQLMMMQKEQQQQLQGMHQQQLSGKKTRPKSAKTNKSTKSTTYKPPFSYSNYGQTNMRKSSKSKKKKGTMLKKKINANQVAGGLAMNQGVMMNNYFPALEQNYNQQDESQNASGYKDQKYPKFGNENINNTNQNFGGQQDPIDEVPPEQEEGESQENIQTRQPNFYQQEDQQTDQDQDVNQGDQDEDPNQFEPTQEQLVELIQNAHNLSPEEQAWLQMVIQQRIQQDPNAMLYLQHAINERAQSYSNVYSQLMENVQKAKEKLAPLGQFTSKLGEQEDTDERILRQKQEFEALYRLYQNEVKNRENKKQMEDNKLHKKLERESKIQSIKEKKFQEELIAHQKSLQYKRKAQQVKLCQKVYKLASELEKNKLLAEKREFKETFEKKKVQNKLMVDAIETYYFNQIQMLKEKIQNERIERSIAQKAQSEALNKMKREINNKKKQEVDKYLQMLKLEDQKYDYESNSISKLENQLIRMYKK